jgi:uncharacterized damage-inducible protein DinB
VLRIVLDMATTADLLVDAFGRVQESVEEALADLTDEELATSPEPGANSVAWLVWHLTRVMDDHVAHVADGRQVWLEDGWARRFGLPFDDKVIGYGQTTDDVARVRVGADLLRGYHDATYARVVEYVRGVGDADLDRVVDTRWDPPVTLGVRLVSVVNDATQHVGQAAYVRGILLRRR